MDEKKITIELTLEELKRVNHAMFILAYWELSEKVYEYYLKELAKGR